MARDSPRAGWIERQKDKDNPKLLLKDIDVLVVRLYVGS
jgi:hypothetical protein